MDKIYPINTVKNLNWRSIQIGQNLCIKYNLINTGKINIDKYRLDINKFTNSSQISEHLNTMIMPFGKINFFFECVKSADIAKRLYLGRFFKRSW